MTLQQRPSQWDCPSAYLNTPARAPAFFQCVTAQCRGGAIPAVSTRRVPSCILTQQQFTVTEASLKGREVWNWPGCSEDRGEGGLIQTIKSRVLQNVFSEDPSCTISKFAFAGYRHHISSHLLHACINPPCIHIMHHVFPPLSMIIQ